MDVRKKIIIVCLFFLVLSFSKVSFGQEDFSRKEKQLFLKYQAANKDFEKGKEYFLKGKIDKAEKEMRNCLKKMPEYANAYFFLSQISYKKGDLNEALEQITKAKENYQVLAKMKMNMEQVRILKMQQQREEGARSQAEAGTLDNRLSRPVPEEEEVPADFYYFHGNIYFKLQKPQEAHDQYVEAIKRNPKHGDAYNNLASLFYMIKKYDKALEYLNMAEENDVKINADLKAAVLKILGK